MAALNHMKNRKLQKTRDGYEDFIARCLDGGTAVRIDLVKEVFENMDVTLEEKDVKEMEKLAKKDRSVPRLEVFFILIASCILIVLFQARVYKVCYGQQLCEAPGGEGGEE